MSIGSSPLGLAATASHLRVMTRRTYQSDPPTCLHWNPITSATTFLRPRFTPRTWCRNINLLAIDYAFRPHLRFRLTLRGLTTPRNPWAYGGRGSHPSYATHVRICSCISSSPPHEEPSTVNTMLPYPGNTINCVSAGASVLCLSPVTSSARTHLTSELLRFL